jgi:hypothetical protein
MRLPMIDVERAEGGRFDRRSLWQHTHVVLLIAHEDCEACAEAERALEVAAAELDGDHARALVVRSGAARSGLATLRDPAGALAERLEAEPGSGLAIDRFFEVLSTRGVHGDPAGAVRAAVDRIDLAELACDECGAPTW